MANDSSGADIRLTVGLDTSCSKTFAAEVQAMVSSMEVPKIKVGLDIDDSSLNNLRSQLGKIGNGNSFKDFGNQAKSSANSVNELTKSVNNYTGSAKQLESVQNTYKNSIDKTTLKITSQVDANGKLIESNRQVTQSFKTQAQKSQEAETVNAKSLKMLSSIAAEYDKLQTTTTKNGGATELDTAYFDQLSSYEERIKTLVKEFRDTGDIDSFNYGLKELQSTFNVSKTAIDQYINSINQAARAEEQIAKTGDQMAVAENKVQESLREITTLRNELTGTRSGTNEFMSELDGIESSFKELYATMQYVDRAAADGTIDSSQYNEYANNLKTAYKEIDNLLNSLVQRQEAGAKAAQEYVNVVKQVAQTTQSIISQQTSISNVDGGTDTQMFAQYGEYINRLNELFATYQTNHSIEDFKLGFTELQAEIIRTNTETKQYIQTQKQAESVTKASISATKQDVQARNQHIKVTENAKEALEKYSDVLKSSDEDNIAIYNDMQAASTSLDNVWDRYERGEMTASQCAVEMQGLNSVIKEDASLLDKAGYGAETLGQKFSNLVQTFTGLFSASRLINYAISAMRNMISESIELNDAMTQLRIVTNETEAAYEGYGSTVVKTAQEIGASISDLVDSTTTYARLGYTLEESSDLAEYTSMLQNVGDIEVADAQDALTSMIKAFGIETDEIESVMDKLVAVGNNYPISVEQLAAGMTNASSTLSAAGNDLEQSIALLMAANVTISFCRTM